MKGLGGVGLGGGVMWWWGFWIIGEDGEEMDGGCGRVGVFGRVELGF